LIETITIPTQRQGLVEITDLIRSVVRRSDISEGICNLLVQHTSASLIIQENADPSARSDLEKWLCRIVPENDPRFTHCLEGADDMPAHIKCAITASTLSIPIIDGELALGTWQGIYLWEHRHRGHQRRVVVHVG
jgi:secondary thiamine-phosphate synthase enzyme